MRISLKCRQRQRLWRLANNNNNNIKNIKEKHTILFWNVLFRNVCKCAAGGLQRGTKAVLEKVLIRASKVCEAVERGAWNLAARVYSDRLYIVNRTQADVKIQKARRRLSV
uniref:Uncharacterized protein n=1 Tax=Kryptolebias marmoratus TaxID=37003 RepID=A0A3Q3A6X7_KRYMA